MTRTTPYPFQLEDVRRMHREFDGRGIDASEVGLGKTLKALMYADRYLPDDPPGPVVCVVPAHLKINWSREAVKHLGWHVEILYGRRAPADKPAPVDPNHVYVVNYDILCPPDWKPRTAPPRDSWLAWLIARKPRLVVADEGHYLGNYNTIRTRAVRYMARRAPRVMILTGTPIANKPPQLWPLLNIVRPDLYPSRQDFCEEYTYARRKWYGWEFKGARNLDRLHEDLVARVMIRRRKADVFGQLPAVTHTVVPVEVNLREYRKAESDYVGWLEREFPLLAKSAAKAEELSKLHFLKRLAGRLKLDAVATWVGDFLASSDSKLLLGAIHYAVTEPLMKEFGRRAVAVNGRMSNTQKQAAFDRFNHDPSCRLCVGNLQAAGTGWSCTSTSDGVVVELPWVPGEVEQFVGRFHGIQRGVAGVPAHMRYLVAVGTVDEDICNLIQVKQMWARRAIDGLGADKDFNLYDRVRARIKSRVAGKGDG